MLCWRARRTPLLARRSYPSSISLRPEVRRVCYVRVFLCRQAGRPLAIDGYCKSTTDENSALEVHWSFPSSEGSKIVIDGFCQGPPDGLSGGDVVHEELAFVYSFWHFMKEQQEVGGGLVRTKRREMPGVWMALPLGRKGAQVSWRPLAGP